MAAWNYERLVRSLEAKELMPIYALYGDEVFLIDEMVKSIIEFGLGGGPKDFNFDTYYGSEGDATAIRDAVEMLPMMAERRIVLVKDADRLSAKDLEALQPIAESPIDSAVLVLVGEKLDLRKKFFKLVEKSGAVVKFDRLPEGAVLQWIQFLCERQGKRIEHEASILLLQMVGPSLLDLNNEILKLSQFIGARAEIGYADVESIVSHSRIESVFGLTAAIGEKDKAKALIFLAQLLDHGESEVGILALVSRHLRILVMIQEAVASGLPKGQISQRVGVPSFFLDQYLKQSKKWTHQQLQWAMGSCLETDRALKSSPISGHIWLENFILRATDVSAGRESVIN